MSVEVEATSWGFRAFAIGVAVASGVAFIASGGNPGAALAPVALWGFWVGFRALPAGGLAMLFFFVILVIDNTSENPGGGHFRSFLYYPGLLFYVALSNLTRIPGLKMFGIEIVFALLAIFSLSRTQFRSRFSGEVALPMPKSLKWIAWGVLAYLIGWWALGIARGGNFSYSLLQVRVVAWTVALPLFFFPLLRTKKHILGIFAAIVAAAFVRACVGIFYWATLMRHILAEGIGEGNYVMLHSDSALMASAFFIVLFGMMMRPKFRYIALGTPYLGLMLFFVFINERRLAYVAIGFGCVVAILVMGKSVRRNLGILMLVMSPLFVVYAGAGWNSGAGWAKPVQTLKSVFEQEDSSSISRDIENYNLIYTAKTATLFGIGYGRGYIEAVPLPDISSTFAAYRFVPHNAILSLFMFCGVVGFSIFFLFVTMGAFFASRLAHFGRDDMSRWVGQVVLGIVITYLVLTFGDMGMASFTVGILFGIAVTVAAVACAEDGILDAQRVEDEGSTPFVG